MVFAIPAGIALAASIWVTRWVSARFDAAEPPPWTRRRHAREIVSVVIMTSWMAACLLAGQAFLLFEKGVESPALFALGAGIAASGAVPSLLDLIRARAKRRRS